MKSIKKINLEDNYLNPAKVRFYTTDWTSNGTSELIIVDDMGQVITCLDEFLFGPPLDHNRNGETFGGVSICPYGEGVWLAQGEDSDAIKKDHPEMIVYPVTFKDVLNHMAESPVTSRLGQLKKLVRAIKEGV